MRKLALVAQGAQIEQFRGYREVEHEVTVEESIEKTIINPEAVRRAGEIDWWSVSHETENTFYFDVLTRLLVNSVWSRSWEAGIRACSRLRLVSNINDTVGRSVHRSPQDEW